MTATPPGSAVATAATDPLPAIDVASGGGAWRDVTCPGGLKTAAPLGDGGPASSAVAADDPDEGDDSAAAAPAAAPKVATPKGAGEANAERGGAAAGGGPEFGRGAGMSAGSVQGAEAAASDTGTIGAATVALSVKASWYGRLIVPVPSRREDASAPSAVDGMFLRCSGISLASIRGTSVNGTSIGGTSIGGNSGRRASAGGTPPGRGSLAGCPIPTRGVNIDTNSGSACRWRPPGR